MATLQTIKPVGALGAITGPTSVCAGKAGLTFSVAAVSEATKYVWTVPDGARIVSGQGTRTIGVTWGSNSGEVSVKATNSCFVGTPRTLAVAIPSLTITQQPVDQTLLENCNQNVSFTAAAAGTPAPTVQWQASTDGGRSWMNLSGKTSATLSLMNPTPAQNGNKFRAVFSNGCAATTSSAATLVATRIQTESGVIVTPSTQQYSDTVTMAAAVTPGSRCGLKAATDVTFYIGTRKVGTVPLTVAGDTLAARLSDVAVQEKPGVYAVKAIFGGLSPYFSVTNATNTLEVTAEDARATYAGPVEVKATSAGRATVALKATVKDVTAVDASDTSAGKIVNARVAFVNRGTGQVIKEVPVVASKTDPKVGTATYSFPVNLGTETSVSYTIGVVVKDYYAQDDTGVDQVITVRKP